MSYLVFADVQALHIQTTALYSLALLLVWPQNDIGPYTSSAPNIHLSSFWKCWNYVKSSISCLHSGSCALGSGNPHKCIKLKKREAACVFLWPPYVMGQAIIFLPRGFFFFLLFFPRLISAVTDWISTILRHIVWPWSEFRMPVWNVLHAARWKCRTQKLAKKSPSGHHRTTLSDHIFATKAHIDNQKKT